MSIAAIVVLAGVASHAATRVEVVTTPPAERSNKFYSNTRAPLRPTSFAPLPITAFRPGGWLRRSPELQRQGLTGHLGEISIWLTKQNNAWLDREGKGDYGWEEVPYWLRGYARIAYVLADPVMIEETRTWVEGVLNSQRENGDFGPAHIHKLGFRDLWAQMLMLQVLQSYYEYSADPRVVPFMTKYFRWQMTIPDEQFLKDYWENSRGGDNLASVYWLYNLTGDSFLLDLATKIDRNTANWRQKDALPNWHVVNIAECFREPATYYLQSGKTEDLKATYDDFRYVRQVYGQVPGGMFGADENARPGHDDPHQAAELCSMVEQIGSAGMLLRFTGDTKWAENIEDVAFNTMPAALTPDYRALRYLTAPNQVVSDRKNHAPGVANEGPFFLMNPFSSRCCQHNHSSAWVNYLENAWMAAPDNGLAAQLYTEGSVRAKAGASGEEVTLITMTKYPFDDTSMMNVASRKPVEFPLFLRIPSWCSGPSLSVNGKPVEVHAVAGAYLKVTRTWNNGDKVTLRLPMNVRVREWARNKNSVSVDYGPLTFSLKIAERYVQVDSAANAIGDSRWQPGADRLKWPSFEILPNSDWNYGLILNQTNPAASFEVIRKSWPADDYPFTSEGAPLELRAQARKIPEWTLDKDGLCGVLPQSPVHTHQPATPVTLIPMGAARLRISAFPVVN